jgi:hypothetical protein
LFVSIAGKGDHSSLASRHAILIVTANGLASGAQLRQHFYGGKGV